MRSTNDAGLNHFIKVAQSYPTLSREDEQALVRRWQENGDQRAADKLLRAHLRFVISSAFKYQRYGIPVSELVSEGNVGLVYALGKFDPDRGFRFVTYAGHWVRAHIINHVIKSWSLVSGGAALRSKSFFKLRRERARVTAQLGETPESRALLASRMGMKKSQVDAMIQRLESRDVSLSAPVFDDSGTQLVDRLSSDAPNQAEILDEKERASTAGTAVQAAVSQLDQRERYIVTQRLMADPEDELTLAELGRRLGVSRERARQLESRAKGKLREWLSALGPDPAAPSLAA